MNIYFRNISILFKRLILVLILLSISWLVFYFLNYSYFSDSGIWETIKLFIAGTQYDIATALAFNILFIILYLLPGSYRFHRNFHSIMKILFIVVNGIILASNFADCEYFKFVNKRTTADILPYIFLSDDLATLMPRFIMDFWYLFLIWFSTIFALWYFYPKQAKPEKSIQVPWFNYIYQGAFSILLLGVFLVGFRGIRLKPLRIIDAARYTETKNIPLVLNTPFTILKTIGNNQLTEKNYFTENEAKTYFNTVKDYSSNKNFRHQNVVILIMESFSKEYIGALSGENSYTPFLDSLSKHALIFPNAFANGKRSIEAMPSIIASLPTLMTISYISSGYSTNNINSLASLLKNKGYHTSFFHGGSNGTMGFDNFAHAAGIDEYYGMNEYGKNEDFDGNWGIFDEEFLQFYATKLNSFEEPFFSTVFTLSSHHPYTIPGKYKEKFRKGPLKILEAIGYSDFSLKQFFKTASEMPWFENTLFIITADHTAQAIKPEYKTNIGQFRVPIIFFHPTDSSLQGENNLITQQLDIMPSVLDYLDYNKPFISFGNSVLRPLEDHFAITFQNGIYQFIENGYTLIYNQNEGPIALYHFETDPLLENNLLRTSQSTLNEMVKKIESIIQEYNRRMIRNEMVVR
ncbi:MAG: sulfatase-like hydrolase/transferase [Bacteroidetes bacterium]|nr:sulfatase-like hydrolase/transferase [Bacteroidota bacterium]